MMDGIIESNLTFSRSLLVLENANMINKGFKEGCFPLWNGHILFLVFMFCRFLMAMMLLNYVVMLVLTLIIKF
jgi:hypothetical protein